MTTLDDPEDHVDSENWKQRERKRGPKKRKKKKRRTVLTYDPWWSRSAYIKNHVQPETALSLCLRPDVITS